jgi:spore germination protein GerM
VRRLLLGLAGLALVAGCGVPRGGEVQPLSTQAVPYGLLKAKATPTATPSAAAATTVAGKVAFVDRGRGIRLTARSVPAGASVQVADELLGQLVLGPTPDERERGFDSVVPPTSRLTVVGITEGVAAVDLSGDLPGQNADRLPIAAAQVVFTVTSVDTINAVTFQRDGVQIDGVLGDGTLTLAPLRRKDYSNLLK